MKKVKEFCWWMCKAFVTLAMVSATVWLAKALGLRESYTAVLGFGLGWLAAWIVIIKMK